MNAAPDLVALNVQVLGTLIFCVVFVFLWLQSGILYFGYWGLAWGLQVLALFCLRVYFLSSLPFWLGPYALFEFAFALALLAAARAGPRTAHTLKSTLRVLLGFPLFLAIIYLLGLQSNFEGFQAVHGLVLGSIYLYTFFAIRGSLGVGGRLFKFTLLGLALAFLHNAVVFFYIYNRGGQPQWPRYLRYNSYYDFALLMLLAFSAMAMLIQSQRDRIEALVSEVDSVRRDSLKNLDLDRLTGLLNQSALERSMESGEPFTGVVAVCDMDNFKSINDQYGHLVGDEILRNIGHLLRSSVRQEDEAFRWGGDEFVILFRNQNLPVVRSRMLEVRRRLSNFRVRGIGAVPLSFSWGAAEAAGEPLRQLLDAADHDMYSYKRRRSAREAQT
ncbi:MAG: GGDEF domain-containing protein [Acidobacteriia bacterium]|nr:GGDEF domain-containing protein [Terriglobia bacterium]